MNAADVSRLLFQASEQLTEDIDHLEASTGRTEYDARVVRDAIDAFRREQGWSPVGFGGEE